MSRSDAWPRCAGVFLVALHVTLEAAALDLNGGITWVGLATNSSAGGDDQTLSIDVNIVRPTGRGQWLAYLEGSSSLAEDGASTIFPESNADAGTALDEDRDGRAQLSELHYRLNLGARSLTLGLLDPSSYLDRTRITNDENVQFLGASFVNNPTIEFPDYTLGAVYQRDATARAPQVNAVLAASNGLADNPKVSYSQLLRIGDDDKGFFAAVGLGWPSDEQLVRVGLWLNTRSHHAVSGAGDDRDNLGWYAVYGRSWGVHALNLRAGAAREDVTLGPRFGAIAYRYRFGEHAVGLAVARVFLSPDSTDPLRDDTSHFEIFGRWAITSAMHLTVSGQHLANSGFHAAPDDPRRSVALAGLRFHYAF